MFDDQPNLDAPSPHKNMQTKNENMQKMDSGPAVILFVHDIKFQCSRPQLGDDNQTYHSPN